MNWLKSLVEIVTSEEVMRPLILVGISLVWRSMGRAKADRALSDLAVDVVDYIEEHYKQWGIRGDQKMAKFIEIFGEEFKKTIGRPPCEAELNTARIKAEAQVQRARRSQIKK
ncbi:MAG: hypothetical protein ACM3TT_03165 [Syntrophothermus sp.]